MIKDYEELIQILKNCNFDLYIQKLKKLMPSRLYRYYEHNNETIDAILNNELLLSNPLKFNDPYDSVSNDIDVELKRQRIFIDTTIRKILYFSSDVVLNELKNLILSENILSSRISYNEKSKILKDQIRKVSSKYSEFELIKLGEVEVLLSFIFGFTNKFIGDFVSNSKISCFSEEKNDLLMWAHYGKHCSGFCIEYSTEYIIQDILENEYFMIPVIYSDKFYSDYGTSSVTEKTLSYLWNLPQFMFKHSRWSYEKEWRLVLLESDKRSIKSLPVKHIYLGSDFSPSNPYKLNEKGHEETAQLEKYVALIEYAKEKNIPISMLQPHQNSYDFVLH